MDDSLLMWGLLFSSIGLGYFLYGKRQKKAVTMFVGLGLMVFPFFISHVFILLAIGSLLVALPFFIKV